MEHSRLSPLGKCFAARIIIRGETVVIKLVCGIENQEGTNVVEIKGGHQMVICREVVTAFDLLGGRPVEISAYPFDPCGGHHFHLPGKRVGEVDVHSQGLGYKKR